MGIDSILKSGIFKETHPALDTEALRDALTAVPEHMDRETDVDSVLADFGSDYFTWRKTLASPAFRNTAVVSRISPARVDETERSRTGQSDRVNTFVLRDLGRHVAESGDGSSSMRRILKTLDALDEFARLFTTSNFSFGDVRLVTLAVALGVFGDEYAAPAGFRPSIADECGRIFLSLADDRRSSALTEFRVHMLARVVESGRLYASRPLDEVFSGFDEYSVVDAEDVSSVGPESLRVVAESTALDVPGMCRSMVGTLREEFFTGNVPGARTVFALSGRKPSTGSFWWIPALGGERKAKASEMLSSFVLPDDCDGALAAASEFLREKGVFGPSDAEAALLLSELAFGVFDLFAFKGAKSPWTRRASDVDAASPFDSPDFVAEMDIFERSGTYGKTISDYLAADCVRRLSVSPVGYDLRSLSEEDAVRHGVLVPGALRWTARKLPEVLSRAESGTDNLAAALSIPCSPDILSTSSFLRFFPLLAKNGKLSARDSVSACALLRDAEFSCGIAGFVRGQPKLRRSLEYAVESVRAGICRLFVLEAPETHPMLGREYMSERAAALFNAGAESLIAALAKTEPEFASFLASKLASCPFPERGGADFPGIG